MDSDYENDDAENDDIARENREALIKDMMSLPLEKMPLYINDPNKHRRVIATWRLKIAK